MPVVASRETAAATGVARSALLERLPHDLHRVLGDGIGAAGLAGRLAMLPIFSLGVDALHARRLDRAWRSGWRYLWACPDLDFAAAVDLRASRTGGARLIRYRFGRAPARLARLVGAVEADHAGRGPTYRARLLQLAPLRMEGLWLCRRGPDRLIGVTPALDDEAFLEEAVRRIESMAAG